MMTGGMIGSRAPSALPPDQLSTLRALARLLDPDAGPEIERIGASLPREDVAQALLGLKELIDTLTAMTPLEAAVAAAIEDLQQREAALAEREAKLVKREQRAAAVDRALTNFAATL
jgi:hypothetical protein